ncbi:MAG: hypothetical protein HFJ26_04080 [Clostridia bacterium]|nr:hypothetical protein [Clostridia bacterium]
MNFNTLEIIGLAFLSGLNIAEIAEDVMNEEETEKKECEGKHCKTEQEDIKTKIEDKIGKVEVHKITSVKDLDQVINNIKKIMGGN